jgi:hypothetical protein
MAPNANHRFSVSLGFSRVAIRLEKLGSPFRSSERSNCTAGEPFCKAKAASANEKQGHGKRPMPCARDPQTAQPFACAGIMGWFIPARGNKKVSQRTKVVLQMGFPNGRGANGRATKVMVHEIDALGRPVQTKVQGRITEFPYRVLSSECCKRATE